MISPFTIQKILDAARVDEVLGDFITLKRRGANLIANCPFHNEKTPSFIVSPAKGIYKCFGCSAAGNSVKFIMEHEKLSYPDALRYLAKKYNIEIEEIETSKEAKEITDFRDSLFIALEYAKNRFQDNLLNTEEGKSIGLSYFKERGFSDEIIKQFQLGYCLDQWSAFTDGALKDGYQLDILIKAGLTKQGDNNKTRDFYKGRVVIPIHNLSGKVIGFGGRILVKSDNAPKYINTPETDVYQKSKVLYGMYQARKGIRKENYCLLVEGYTDVISLFQGGVDNVVASSGTSLTEDQVKQIKKFTDHLVILYDGDAAGVKAALRGLDIALEQGLNIKLVLLPHGEDPDSYIRNQGAQVLKDYIKENASDFILFKIKLLQAETKNDPNKKAELIQDIIESIGRITDPIKRSVYIKECSVMMDIQEQLIINEVQKRRKKKYYDAQQVPPDDRILMDKIIDTQQTAIHHGMEPTDAKYICEKDICRILLESGKEKINETETVADFIFASLEGIEFKQSPYLALFNHIRDLYFSGTIMDIQYYNAHELDAISKPAIELTTLAYELANWNYKSMDVELPVWGDNYIRDMESTINRYKILKIEELFSENSALLKKAEEDQNHEDLMMRLQLSMELQKMKRELSEKLRKVV
jgi:DNA primase